MAILPVLPKYVQAVQEFQQLGLVNKAILDATAVDIPLVGLAKNKTEQKERFVRQALVLAIAFLIAPFHAKIVSKLFAKQHKIPETLLQVPFKKLFNLSEFQQSAKQIIQHNKITFKTPLNLNEALRKTVVKAKTGFMMTDLAVCGFLMSSVGYIKVLFGKLITGKKQFTGEAGIVSENTLNKIYETEKQNNKAKVEGKDIANFTLGIGVPLLLGAATRKAFLKPVTHASRKFFHKLAPLVDYNYSQYSKTLKGWPLISDGGMILLAGLLTLGELTSARSPREFKELAIQRNSIDALFFFGTPMFMKLLSGSTTVKGAIERVAAKSPKLIQQAAKRSANAYIASYLLAAAAVSGIVVVTNNMTKKGVKDAAEKLSSASSTHKQLLPVENQPYFQPNYPYWNVNYNP